MEREGVLDGRLDGRRKAYALPGAPAMPAAEQEAPVPAAQGVSRGSRGELVAVVTALFVAASLVAFVLAPDKNGDTGSASAASVVAPAPAPAAASTKPAPEATPKPKPRNTGALAAAKRTQVAVLSGSAVPGIAKRTGAALKRKGFRVGTVTNAPGPSQRSAVLYARGKKKAAAALARSAKIRAINPVDPNSQAIAPKAGLIVVIGADRKR
jgi:hypothetical protein